MADNTPAEIIKTKIIKIHKKKPTNTYPADDKKRKKPRETALAAASRVDDNLTVTVFPSRLHITSGAGVFQHRWSAGRTDRQWLRRRRKKGADEENSPKSASVVSLGLHKAGQYMSQYMSINASLIYLKLSSCRWVSRLQQSINGKKKNTFFYSSLPYCCSLLHLHVKPIAE